MQGRISYSIICLGAQKYNKAIKAACFSVVYHHNYFIFFQSSQQLPKKMNDLTVFTTILPKMHCASTHINKLLLNIHRLNCENAQKPR